MPGDEARRAAPGRGAALLSLILLVPVPSLAVYVGLIAYPDTWAGRLLFGAGKIWVLLLPLLWLVLVERGRPTLPAAPWRVGGLALGLASGLAIAAVIVATYLLVGRSLIDPAPLRAVAANIGMDSRAGYLALAGYWCLVNALLEEYVWRWFVVRQLRRLAGPLAAVLLGALAFTLHHVVATQIYFSLPLVLLAAFGIAVGGAIWSWLYLRYASVWPGYLSHVLADLAIFAIGYRLLFS